MIRFMGIALSMIFITSTVFADSYMGLTPGESIKADVDQAFGAPIREVITGVHYDYQPESHDAKRLSAVFNKDTGILESINFYFQQKYTRDQLVEWLSLENPTDRELDDRGNLVEYFDSGISFHYDGPDVSSSVKRMAHYDPQLLTQDVRETDQQPVVRPQQAVRQQPGATQQSTANQKTYGIKQVFLGLQIISNNSESGVKVMNIYQNSPAHHVGFQLGDIILKIGEITLGSVNRITFRNIVGQMPIGVPIPFLIQRGKRQFQVFVQLESKSAQEVASMQFVTQPPGSHLRAVVP